MKKRVNSELDVPVWILDGFTGILALVIYNFILYILTAFGIKGFIAQLQEAMGYFGLNSFLELGFKTNEMFIGIVIFFGISFLLGVGIGNKVRDKRRKK